MRADAENEVIIFEQRRCHGKQLAQNGTKRFRTTAQYESESGPVKEANKDVDPAEIGGRIKTRP